MSTTRGFLLGIGLSLATVLMTRLLFGRFSTAKNNKFARRGRSIYGLEHGRLNVTLPPPTMWMNMGYWENTMDFPTACRSLLDQVLKTAGFFDVPPNDEKAPRTPRPVTIVDIGFGCGDQTLHLREILRGPAFGSPCPNQAMYLRNYVGITLNHTQHQYAEDRLDHGLKSEVFCADAAKPESWPQELADAVHSACKFISEPWVLALDTLYHFSPSRWPIVNYARRELDASFMAFDLLLAEKASLRNRLLLAVVSRSSGSPYVNFVTVHRYREMLVSAGYSDENIVIQDVSEHVFAPLAGFLDEREKQLGMIGLSIGGFRVAKWMFRWWAKSGIVRGCIVVAKK